MKIADTYQLAESIKSFLKEMIPTMTMALLEESVDFTLPEIREYQVGYVDVFNLTFYPSIFIGCGKTTPAERFSDTYEIDIVFVHKNGNKNQLIKEGYLYSDILYYLFRTYHRLNGASLNIVPVEREHFEGDELFVSSLLLRVEVENGEYGK
ncbi:MAG: hypothetical protein ACOWWR_07830 [Eubacteriales bacterium]